MMNFDNQAQAYDQRVGFTGETISAIRDFLFSLKPEARVLEIGAGTGFVGIELAEKAASYTGLDASEGMLSVFRERAAERGLKPTLVQADADKDWGIPGSSCDLIFGSRVFHLLEPEHLSSEILRVADQGAILASGNVLRPKDSVHHGLRRILHQLLREEGYEPKKKKESLSKVFSSVSDGGNYTSKVVSEWTRPFVPADAIASWEHKHGLAGNDLPEDLHNAIVVRVKEKATAEFGDLTKAMELREFYQIDFITIIKP
jgi:ubiquinone/menaquinone biosynthesis C-methylase UbiE